MADKKLRLLADAWRQNEYDENGEWLRWRRRRQGDVVTVDDRLAERLLAVEIPGDHPRPMFEEVKSDQTQAKSPEKPSNPDK